jgi:acyl dehydratase
LRIGFSPAQEVEMSEEHAEVPNQVHRFRTARRTVTETDIVNFVNLAALHEPPFVDMEFIKANMPESHWRRFAPAPMIISFGMGLVAPLIAGILDTVLAGELVGFVGGMTGVEARVKAPVYPGDTLQVDVESYIKKKTSRGFILIDLRHIVKNQHDTVVVDFTETVLYLPRAQ